MINSGSVGARGPVAARIVLVFDWVALASADCEAAAAARATEAELADAALDAAAADAAAADEDAAALADARYAEAEAGAAAEVAAQPGALKVLWSNVTAPVRAKA